jgi:hypothetical protein
MLGEVSRRQMPGIAFRKNHPNTLEATSNQPGANLLAVSAEGKLGASEETQGNTYNRQPPIAIANRKICEGNRLPTVERRSVRWEVDDHVLGCFVNGDVSLLDAATERLDNVSFIVDEDCSMAPVRKNLVRTPIAEGLAESDESPKDSGRVCQDEVAWLSNCLRGSGQAFGCDV